MKKIGFIMFVLLFLVLGCSSKSDTTSSPKPNENNQVAPPEQMAEEPSFIKSYAKALHAVAIDGLDIDNQFVIDTLLKLMEKGEGFEVFGDYCFDKQVGAIPVETCEIFANGLLQGGWKASFDETIINGANIVNVARCISLLSRSLEDRNPELSKKLIDYYFEKQKEIKDPINLCMARITMASELHLNGFDNMDAIINEEADKFIKLASVEVKKINEITILNVASNIAVVNYTKAWELVQSRFTDEFLQAEGKAAIAGGLMSTDYERGKKFLLEALSEAQKFRFNEDAKTHHPFEFAYSELKPEDQKKALPDFLNVVLMYNRFNFTPPSKYRVLSQTETELPAWYRDTVYKWFVDKYPVNDRIALLYAALNDHCARYPNSPNTEIFVGWALEWNDEIKDPKERYMNLGRFFTIENCILPNNIAIAKPRIEKTISGLENKLPAMDINDALLGVLLFKEPKQFKKLLDTNKANLENPPFLFGFMDLLRMRHYMHPDSDAGLAKTVDEFAEKWQLPEDIKTEDISVKLAQIWAGWDDNKAWEKVKSLKEDGEYPQYVIKIMKATKPYAQGFAARCMDDLLQKYDANVFKLSNPAMESEITKQIGQISVPWALQFAEKIVQKRGNKSPDFSLYSLYPDLLITAFTTGASAAEIRQLSKLIQDELIKDSNSILASESMKGSQKAGN